MVKKTLISKIVNVILLILFIILLVNSIIIQFHLVQPLYSVKQTHIWLGWLFFLFIFIHILLNISYYRKILIFRRENGN